MKTAEPTEEEQEHNQIEHPLFEEALEEEDVRPEAAIEKFKASHRRTSDTHHCNSPAPTNSASPRGNSAASSELTGCSIVSVMPFSAADPNGKLVKIKEESIMHLATLYSKLG